MVPPLTAHHFDVQLKHTQLAYMPLFSLVGKTTQSYINTRYAPVCALYAMLRLVALLRTYKPPTAFDRQRQRNGSLFRSLLAYKAELFRLIIFIGGRVYAYLIMQLL